MSKQLIDQLDGAIAEILSRPGVVPSVDASLREMLQVVQELRDLPAPDFRASLKTELERKAIMSAKTSAKSVVFRPGFRTITPYLIPPGPEFVDFLKNVFDAEETERTSIGPNRFHAEFRIGDSMLMVGVGSGRTAPAMLELYVPNVDELHKRAIAAGCRELQPVIDAHWEPLRFSSVEDPAGNAWVLATHRGGASYVPEGRNSLTASLVATGSAQLVEFIKKAFDGNELQRYEWQGGLYAAIQIGDSVVGVSEAANHEWMRPMQASIYMYVPDCDAVYERALRSGATSLSVPADHDYGDRSGGVKDAWGNVWYMATPL
jgi:uncharacterized glyoxalase superfamily protein PhnB